MVLAWIVCCVTAFLNVLREAPEVTANAAVEHLRDVLAETATWRRHGNGHQKFKKFPSFSWEYEYERRGPGHQFLFALFLN